MKTPVTRHEPFGVFPDLAPEKHGPDTAKSARNIRMNPTPPKGGQSRVRVPGNEEVPNSFLPSTGTNWNVGVTKNNVTGQQYSANYNSNGVHGIYRFSEPDVWEVVIEGDILDFKQRQDSGAADYVKDYVVNMLFHPSGLLLWQDGIQEDRVINVERGIATFGGGGASEYQLPIRPFVLAQLHRRPAYPVGVYGLTSVPSTLPTYISETVPKPITDIPLRAIQFGYNYGYMDGIESGISEASITNWNNGPFLYLIIPDEEFYDYMSDGVFPGTPPTEPNPYIQYVKFYFRLGNTNEWNLFRKVNNTNSNWLSASLTPAFPGTHFGITLPKMEELQSIGGVSAAALSLVDGIGRSSKGTAYGDSRLLKWYIKSGYNMELPTATITIENVDTPLTRNYRTFPPLISQTVENAAIYFDDRGRIIGGRVLAAQTLTRTDQLFISPAIAEATTPGFFSTNTRTFQDLWDFGGTNFSQQDTVNNPAIKITPDAYSGGLPAPIAKVMLATKAQKGLSNILRTQCLVYAIYKGSNGSYQAISKVELQVYYTFTAPNVIDETFTFHGIGFQMNSFQPINFSDQQNYYIETRGITFFDDLGLSEAAFKGKSFQITEQVGLFLISKAEYEKFKDIKFVYGDLQINDGFVVDPYRLDYRPYYNWSNVLADVLLYSKDLTDKQWRMIPSVSWTRQEYIDQDVRYYYGDSYLTKDEKTIGQSPIITLVLSTEFGATLYSLKSYGLGLAPIGCLLTTASMNLNGIYEEVWDSDIGNTVTIDSEPAEVTLTKGMIHGEQFLLGSKINNMFVFDPLNKSQVTGDIGDLIMVLILAAGSGTGDNIYCVCQSGCEIRFLGKIEQTASNGDQVISLSTNVFGSENTQPWRVGIQSQMEVMNTDEGQAFHFDRVKKVSMQITLGGQDPISMQQFQVTDMATMIGQGVMGYDPLNNEFLYATADSGFAYNRMEKKYQGFRTFGVENKTEAFSFGASEGSGKILYGWSKGKMYRFNSNANPQLINEEPYSASITIISNPAVPLLKNFASVRYLSLAGKVWKAFLTSPQGRETDITIDEFEEYAGYFKGSITRDINSEGGKYDGDMLNGGWIEVEVLDETDTPKDLNFIEIGYTQSLEQ